MWTGERTGWSGGSGGRLLTGCGIFLLRIRWFGGRRRIGGSVVSGGGIGCGVVRL